MFTIYDGRQSFYQWDLDRKLVVEDPTIDKVHFCNRTNDYALMRYVYDVAGLRLVDVPNILLQESYKLRVYGFDKNYTKFEDSFEIEERSRPQDYIWEDTELEIWEELNDRVDFLESNLITPETLKVAIDDYFVENPVEVDLSDFYTKVETNEEINKAVAAIEIPEIPTNISAFTNDAGYLTEHQSLAGLATEEYVNERVAAIPQPDLTNYALKSEIPDLEPYALKTEIPDVSNLTTEEEVQTLIENYVGVITDASY